MQTETHRTWPLPAAELRPALELARALARADMTVLLLHDETQGALVPALAQGIDDEQCALIGTHAPERLDDVFGMALAQHRRVVLHDPWRQDERTGQLARRLGFRAIEIVPLFGIEGQVIGEIAMMFRRSRGTSRRVKRLIEDLSRLVVCAVMHARRRADAERARDVAEQAGRSMIQFFARMSHELRTPLQSIAGYIDLLRVGAADPVTPAQERLLSRAHESEEVLVHIIDELVTFSRLEAGRVAFHISTVPAAEALHVAQSVVAPLATERGVALEVGEPRNVLVAADGDKLKQILVNLAANAVKFSRTGGSVRLDCRVDGDVVTFAVSDDGPGIPSERLRDIFEPYVQLGPPMLDRFGGTGLGLAISREFAHGMHGALSVASTVGLGSEFTLKLPRASSRPVPIQASDVQTASSTDARL